MDCEHVKLLILENVVGSDFVLLLVYEFILL